MVGVVGRLPIAPCVDALKNKLIKDSDKTPKRVIRDSCRATFKRS